MATLYTHQDKNVHKTWFLITILLIVTSVLSWSIYSISSAQFLYKMDSDCAKTAASFVQEKNKDNSISDWELLQNKFIKNKNSCFAEISIYISGTEPNSYIYDLTHNKEVAGFPVNLIKYTEVKSEIFDSLK